MKIRALPLVVAASLLPISVTFPTVAYAAPSAACNAINGGSLNQTVGVGGFGTIKTQTLTFTAGEIITFTLSSTPSNSFATIGGTTIFSGETVAQSKTFTVPGAAGTSVTLTVQTDVRGGAGPAAISVGCFEVSSSSSSSSSSSNTSGSGSTSSGSSTNTGGASGADVGAETQGTTNLLDFWTGNIDPASPIIVDISQGFDQAEVDAFKRALNAAARELRELETFLLAAATAGARQGSGVNIDRIDDIEAARSDIAELEQLGFSPDSEDVEFRAETLK